MPNTISLKADFIRKEAEASAAIMPGHLVEFGGARELQVHSTAGGPARKAWALENDIIGRGIDDEYALGEVVQYGLFPPGAEVYAYIAYGEVVTVGEGLESAGDGSLRVVTTGEIVAWAMEDLDLSAAGGEATRLRVEVA